MSNSRKPDSSTNHNCDWYWLRSCLSCASTPPPRCWRSCAACQNTQSSGHYWTAAPATSDSCNPKRTVTAMPGNPAARPVGVWHCIFTVSSVCASPLPQNTTDLNPCVQANSQGCKNLSNTSSLNAAAAHNIGHCDYVQIAARLQNGQQERSDSEACNVKGDGATFFYYFHLSWQ